MAKNGSANLVFAILLLSAGSLTIGDTRLLPFTVTPVDKELADKVDTDLNQVKFFEKQEDAQALATKIKAAADAKNTPPKS